jgi:hypothetical protein
LSKPKELLGNLDIPLPGWIRNLVAFGPAGEPVGLNLIILATYGFIDALLIQFVVRIHGGRSEIKRKWKTIFKVPGWMN